MARSKSSKSSSVPPTIPQNYPRLEEGKFRGCLDDTKLIPHPEPRRITLDVLKNLIFNAIRDAEDKSSREFLSSSSLTDLTSEQEDEFYKNEGRKLFEYFHDYPSDPAATAHEYHYKNYRIVGTDLFRRRGLQNARMNSGWRYQFLAADCAEHSGRFRRVSGIGTSKGDFNAVVDFLDKAFKPLHLYVSVKNRSDTLGGQDWPNSIAALEAFAKVDQNRTGPYCCVFGVAMDRGQRRVPRKRETGEAHSSNTEVWLSDFFWPFFSAYSYEEIMTAMLEVLVSESTPVEEVSTEVEVPGRVLDVFGEECLRAELIDELGNFDDPFKLVRFFCQKTPPKLSLKKGKKKRE